MEATEATIESLRVQDRALGDQIAELEAAMLASSTPGIREFRRTRLSQLEGQRVALEDRLRRIEHSASPAVEAHMIAAAYRDVTLVAQGTFGR